MTAGTLVIVATVLNFIGLVVSCAVWYEEQDAGALAIGMIFMALGLMLFGIGLLLSTGGKVKEKAKRAFG
ncbi:MAG TPA: hypothetical protein DEB24_03115 [Coriobacteriia bacterium]|nr:hypothetical protein [Coriobacteriia bacterium]